MKDKKAPAKSSGSVDDFMRSVYEALSVKVLSEQAANAPSDEKDAGLEALEDLEAQIRRAGLVLAKPAPAKKRTTR